MNKSQEKIIQIIKNEEIKTNEEYREEIEDRNSFLYYLTQEYEQISDSDLDEIFSKMNKYEQKYFNLLFKVNNLLKYENKDKTLMNLEQELKNIQVKKNITVNEFTKIYNVSKSSQANFRGRLYDPLPFHQKVLGGKIVYVVEEVEKWFQNQHK